MKTCARFYRSPAIVMVVATAIVCGQRRAMGDAFGQSYNHSATISLSGVGGAHLEWSNNPELWYLNAQAYVYHSDSGSAFEQDEEAFEPYPPADGVANVAFPDPLAGYDDIPAVSPSRWATPYKHD